MAEARDNPAIDGPAHPRRLRMLFLLPVLIFLALSVLFLLRLFSGDPSRVPSALIGRPAPTMTLEPLQGLVLAGVPVPGLTPEDMAGGKVTIVNVWASWCGPCRQEHPALMELARDPAVRVVGINYKDQAENARRFLGALGNPYQAVGVDATGRAAIEWGVYGVPETFVVDGAGVIRYKHIGPIMPEQLDAFRARVREAARPN